MSSRKVLLVYPEFPLSYWGFQYSLPIFGKKAMHSPLSLITVAAMCPQDWEYKLIDLNIESLSDEQILWADLVFVSGMGIQQRSLLDVLTRARNLGRRTVLGGPFASGNPQRLMGAADTLVLGEGEVTIPPFLEDLQNGTPKAIYNTDRKPDVTGTPVPRFDLLNLKAYSVIDIQFSRGCPFNCEFCDIIVLYGRVPRTKTPDQILAELDALYKLNYRGPVFLVDDNFIGNKKAVKALLERLVPWMQEREYPFFLTTEASVNLADDEKFLEMMRMAGFKRVFLGIETPSVESLKETQKFQNTRRDMAESVRTIARHGFEVTAGFIVGFDNDTEDIFDRQLEFIKDAEIPWAMVGTLTAIPGTALWKRLEKEGRILGYADGDQFGRPNFKTTMDPELLYQGYLRILETLYTPDNYYDRVLTILKRQDEMNLPNLHKKGYPLAQVIGLSLIVFIILGIKSSYRMAFWRYMFKVITRHPRRFIPSLVNAVIGHHFIKYTHEVVTRRRQIIRLGTIAGSEDANPPGAERAVASRTGTL